MKWIEYDYVCNANRGINLHKKVEYNEENLAIAKEEACDGIYIISEDENDNVRQPIAIESGGTGATNVDKVLENLGFTGGITTAISNNFNADVVVVSTSKGKIASSTISVNELNQLSGIKSNINKRFGEIESQLEDKVGPSHKHSISDINSSKGLILVENVNYGKSLPAAGNKGRLFFKVVE